MLRAVTRLDPAHKHCNPGARMVVSRERQSYSSKVVRALRRHYPDASCSLDFQTPLELLVATILSAQCTDERVNLVTKELFRKHTSSADYARVSLAELERDIRSTGFFRNKAKSIKGCGQSLLAEHHGEVPRGLDALVRLPGIGRKTANVILGTAFGVPSGVVVDTHVGRISRRLGLTRHKDAVKIEKDLMEQIPKKEWISFSHRMIRHGRRICTARKPKCEDCPLNAFCPRIGVAGGQKALRGSADRLPR